MSDISPQGYKYGKPPYSIHPFWDDSGGGGGEDTGDYNNLENKPSINDVTLEGNKTSRQLKIQVSEVTDNSLVIQ